MGFWREEWVKIKFCQTITKLEWALPFKFQMIIVVSLEQDMMNLPLEATAILIISAECLTGKSNSPVTEAPEPSFFLFTLNTRIVFPFAKAVIKALQYNKRYNECSWRKYFHPLLPSSYFWFFSFTAINSINSNLNLLW